MSDHSAGTQRRSRRTKLRVLVLIGVLIGALGISAPALALLGITLPIPSAGNPTTTITAHVEDNSGTDITPNKSLDLSGLNLSGIAGITNLAGGLTQTTTSLTQLLAGLRSGAAVAAPVVQAKATEAAATAITNLKTRAENTVAAAAALDLEGAQDELLANVTDLQSQATGEVAGLLPLALTTGLQVAQNIVTPLCGLTAVPSSLVPGIGLDTTRLWTAAAPVIQQTDTGTNKLLRDSYSNVYDQTLASVNNIPGVGPVASALLLLLKYNWTTSYTPPGTTTPVVTTTKALMNVPTPIDVDNDGLFDLCGTTSFALTGSGTSISGLKVTQSITKMPLAKPVLPVQISGGLLNVINFGYNTTESTVPIIYTSAATLDTANGGGLNIDNTYSVHRGKNLTIPPLSLAALNLTTGDLPTFPPLLTDAPKPIVTQETCIGACSGIAIRDRFENVPVSTHVDGPLASAGVKTHYTAPTTADSFSHTFALGTSITLGASAGRDQSSPEVTTPTATTAPTEFSSCLSITDATCSPNSATTDKFSTSFTASSRTLAEQNLAIGGAASNTCTGVASLGATTHILGTSFNGSATPSTATVGSGRLALDTAGQPAEGCIAGGTVLALTGLPNYTLPTGFSANNRRATYHNTSTFGLLTGTPIDSKTGSITCPAGTAVGYTSLSPLGTYVLAPVICSLPPVNTVAPAITGQALVDATLSAGNGTWTPGAPNAPTFTKQWFRCNGSGAACAPITGATGDTYELQYGGYPAEPTDFGHTFKVAVTGTNLDGTATATSATTAVVALPPPPVIATAPVLGGNRKVGVALTTTNGTYTNGATTFHYTWQRCDASGTPASCAAIVGAPDANAYVLQAADKGLTVRVGVIASNHGGSAPVNNSATVFVPPNPVNTVAPGIKNGPANAVGASVATGDNLSASSGSWDFTTDPFTYQWQRCDAGGNNCADITGATGATYQLAHPADDGGTVRVVVTGHGLNGDTPAASGTTGVILFNDLSAKTVTQIPDGVVGATTAGAGSTTYVGGSFDTVGAPTGGSGLVSDTGSGSSVTLASATAGAANGGVNATVPDGSGGYFLGGSFTQVKGVQCPSLAHISSDGTVDQNYCYSGLTGTVRSLTRAAGATTKVLAVGGDFTYSGHKNLMFIDPTSPANPVYLAGGDPNGVVKTLSVNASTTVYFGGQFSKAGGTDAGLVGSGTLTFTSGQLSSVPRTNWSAGICIGVPTGSSACTDPAASVNTMAWLSSGFVAVGGRFDRNYRVVNNAAPTNTATRSNALLVGESGTAPTLLGWAPVIAGGAQTVNAIAPGIGGGLNNIPIYIGGDFATVNGVAGTKNLAEVGCSFAGTNLSSGTANNSGPMNTWLPNPNGAVTSLAWGGTNQASTLIVGGAFTTIDSRPTTATPFTTLVRHRLAKINIGVYTSATLPVVDANWDPNAGRTVRSVSRDAATGAVTIGGDFLVLGGKTRNNLAEFDPNTGVTTWNPGSDGAVNALAFRSGTVYAGGTFANAGGAARANLAALDGSTGTATSWNPGSNGEVNAIATDAANVYVGGAFSTAGGQSRANLAAIGAGGAATGWNPTADGTVRALAVSGSTVYVGGSFANAGGAARSNAAAIDSSGSATGFNPSADGAVNAVAASNAGVYLGGEFTHVGSDARDRVAFVDPATGAAAAWNPGVNGIVRAVFLIGSQVFVGGDFTSAGGATRSNLAALDAGSDSALSFKPDPNGTVRSLSRTSGGSIVVGGGFTIIAGQAAPALGFFGG
ncbi:MAG: Fibronectin type domain protein [Marmoricola sp.]|nr:Fibronectin type domain protein [Marmoricola sp.]